MARIEVREKVEFQRVAGLDGLEMVRARFFRHHFPRHSHDVFAFGIIEGGAQATDYRGATHVAVAGDVCLVNPGEVHTGYPPDKGGWSYRCCYPDPGLVCDIARGGCGRDVGIPHFPSPVIHDRQVYESFYRMFQAIEDDEDELGLQEKLISAITMALSRHTAHNVSFEGYPGATGEVRRACDYIEGRWSERVRLEDIAAAAEMDSYCLIRTFRKQIGMTPHAYLMQMRIAKGKRLLVSGLSPARVALDTGFYDQSHFTKQFKRFTGTTPSNYMRTFNRQWDSHS